MQLSAWIAVVFAVSGVAAVSDLEADIARIESSGSSVDVLRRSRRYVVFPEGSTFNAAFCITIKSTTGGDAIFTEGVNWGMSYDLPNETVHDRDRYPGKYPILRRRHKRDLYVKMEKLIDSAGMGGRECVLKTICEAGQQLAPRQGILEEIFRILFTNPSEQKSTDEDWAEHGIYRDAYDKGVRSENCNDAYPCPVSILEMGLGFGEFEHPSELYAN